VLVHFQREFLRHRLRVKPRRRLVRAVDQRSRYAVTGQVVEAYVFKRQTELRRGLSAGLDVAGEMTGDIDERDRAGNHRRRSQISRSACHHLHNRGLA
jgi:hypothetical protein